MQRLDPMTCDCFSCAEERLTNPYYTREEEPMTTQTPLTCTCASRYVRDGDHESDCDLWLIDEFWAGFLAWDWDRELLVRTDSYPEGHTDSYTDDSYEWVADYLQQKDELSEQEMVEANLRDRDIALTTDMFIDRMIQKYPEDANTVWAKDDNGFWVGTEQDSGKTTTYTSGAAWSKGGTTPGSYDGYDWNEWASDRHTATPVVFPDGTQVTATSACNQWDRPTPDFGLYLDKSWKPDGMAIMLPWQDFGLPNVSYGFADYAIQEAFSWAKAGALVEVGCIGAHGRTGTVLACMALIADPTFTAWEAIDYVREVFCKHAIETKEQEWYVERFRAAQAGEPIPERPVYVPPTPVVHVAEAGKAPHTSGSGVTGSPSAGPLGDPQRKAPKGKARRSKRGGKRQQNHRNRMTQGSRR